MWLTLAYPYIYIFQIIPKNMSYKDTTKSLFELILDVLMQENPNNILRHLKFDSDRLSKIDSIGFIIVNDLRGIPQLLNETLGLSKPTEAYTNPDLHNRRTPNIYNGMMYRRDELTGELVPCHDFVRGSGRYEQVFISLSSPNYWGNIPNPKLNPNQQVLL